MNSRPKRSNVPLEQTWELEGFYADIGAWEEDAAKVSALLTDLEQFRGHLSDGADTLLDCLRLQDEIGIISERLQWFAANRRAEDQTDPVRQGLGARGISLGARTAAACSFVIPELLAMPEGAVEGYLQTETGLAIYRHYLMEILGEKEHMLGSEAEAVLAELSEVLHVPYDIWQNLTAADIQYAPVIDEHGESVPMSLSALGKLLQSPERRVRAAAYESAVEAYAPHKRTLAATFAAAQKRDWILARLRRYPSSLRAALDPLRLPEELFHNLVRVAEAGSVHLRRYLDYRRRALGLDRLMPYDTQAPLDVDLNLDITFADGCAVVLEALKPLGEEYQAILRAAVADRWIYWADNEGKESGAYSYGCYGFHPVILLDWQGKIGDAFVLAHELGHTVHSVLSSGAQPYVYSPYTSFLAEMASTANELLLAHHLLQTTQDPRLRRYVLTRALGSFANNFFGGSMIGAFQLEVHQMAERGEPLTYESITAAQTAILQRWYGDVLEVAPEGMGSTWSRPPHHFLNFYSYQYATGIAGAAAFAEAIMSEGGPAVERYLSFLRAGSSDHSIAILQKAGVDMTSPDPIERAVAYFAQLVDELEASS